MYFFQSIDQNKKWKEQIKVEYKKDGIQKTS